MTNFGKCSVNISVSVTPLMMALANALHAVSLLNGKDSTADTEYHDSIKQLSMMKEITIVSASAVMASREGKGKYTKKK